MGNPKKMVACAYCNGRFGMLEIRGHLGECVKERGPETMYERLRETLQDEEVKQRREIVQEVRRRVRPEPEVENERMKRVRAQTAGKVKRLEDEGRVLDKDPEVWEG